VCLSSECSCVIGTGTDGFLYGNGRCSLDGTGYAGEVKSGQIITMRCDLEIGCLQFWLDGIPFGPGFPTGVTGPVCWAATLYHEGSQANIVPTPALQPWVEYTPMENPEWNDGDENGELDYGADY
jgi:hypothetical protein